MHGGNDEIPGFHLCRHALDHGGGIRPDHYHPCLGDVGVSVEQEAKSLSRLDPGMRDPKLLPLAHAPGKAHFNLGKLSGRGQRDT